MPPIHAIVIDGANVIANLGSRALARLDLARRWCHAWRPELPVWIGVDTATLTHLCQPRFGDTAAAIARALAAGELHRCPDDPTADEFLLRIARQRQALLLSNDRYGDHADARVNLWRLGFTIAGDHFEPAPEATWLRSPGHAVRVAVTSLIANRRDP